MTRTRSVSKKRKKSCKPTSATKLSAINEMGKNMNLSIIKNPYKLHTQVEMNESLKRVSNSIKAGNKATGAGRSITRRQTFTKRLGTMLSLTGPAIKSAGIEQRWGRYKS